MVASPPLREGHANVSERKAFQERQGTLWRLRPHRTNYRVSKPILFFFFLRGLRTFCEGSHREKVFEKEVSDRKQESCLSVLPAPLAFSLHIINVAE